MLKICTVYIIVEALSNTPPPASESSPLPRPRVAGPLPRDPRWKRNVGSHCTTRRRSWGVIHHALRVRRVEVYRTYSFLGVVKDSLQDREVEHVDCATSVDIEARTRTCVDAARRSKHPGFPICRLRRQWLGRGLRSARYQAVHAPRIPHCSDPWPPGKSDHRAIVERLVNLLRSTVDV